ncbi:MAG: glycosyltransferase family 4 protein [Deltaproteobacteria bacterium]|nr:glycosyltransferase family 4 protein [Deltaproteobacteria bacterium]
MRFFFLTSSYPRFRGDYAGWFVQSLARELSARGHQVQVWAPSPSSVSSGFAEEEGVRVRRFSAHWPLSENFLFYKLGAYENLSFSRAAWFQVPSSIVAFSYAASRGLVSADAVVTNWLAPAGLSAAIANRTISTALKGMAALPGEHGRTTAKHICVLHGSDVEILRSGRSSVSLCRALSPWIDKAFAVSSRVASRAGPLLPDSPIDTMDIPPKPGRDLNAGQRPMARSTARKMLGLESHHRAILFIGRMTPQKGPGLLLSAVPWLKCRNAKVLIAGPFDMTFLQKAAKILHVDARFFEAMDSELKETLFSAADILALPSLESVSGRGEGFPLIVKEALSRGIPVAACPSGGLSWSMSLKNLFLARDFTPSSLAGAIDSAILSERFEPAKNIDIEKKWATAAGMIEEASR